MGSIISNWENQLSGDSISQKVIDRVKPDVPLKNKIDVAQKKLELQISKLGGITDKLQRKHDYIFKKIVDAQKSRNHSYAKAYAIELHEIRKMNNMISNARLSMEQIKIRLNTVSELGDVVVTLSPCMSIIKGLGMSLSGIMPEANASMQDLSSILGNVLTGSSFSSDSNLTTNTNENADTIAILEEAQNIIEGQTRNTIPDIPTNLHEKTVQKERIT